MVLWSQQSRGIIGNIPGPQYYMGELCESLSLGQLEHEALAYLSRRLFW